MRIDKKIREIPWPSEANITVEGDPKNIEKLFISAGWVICNHERLLVLTIRQYSYYPRDSVNDFFRVIISKKNNDFAVIFKGKKSQQQKCLVNLGVYLYSKIKKSVSDKIKTITGTDGRDQLEHLNTWMSEILDKKLLEKRVSNGLFLDDEVDRCPDDINDELFFAWVMHEVIRKDKTMIYKKGGIKGTCSYCGESIKAYAEKVKQYSMVSCPNCGTKTTAVLENSCAFRANYVHDVAYMQRGPGGTLWIRQFHILRDNTAEYAIGVKHHLQEIARYGFKDRKTAMWVKEVSSGSSGRRIILKDWLRFKQLYSYDCRTMLYTANIIQVTAGTVLQYADIENYILKTKNDNPIKYCADFCRYPVMEYLQKAGYAKLVSDKVSGSYKDVKNSILWQRTKLKECFKFPINLLKLRPAAEWDMRKIELMNRLQLMNYTDKEKITLFNSNIDFNSFDLFPKDINIIKFMNYITKQLSRSDKNNRETMNTTLRTYRDYLADCKALKYDLKNEIILYPPDLYSAHQRTISIVEYKKNEALQEKFNNVVEELLAYEWDYKDYVIQPAKSHNELIEEGKALNHCVGGVYAEKMANGKTAIFFIRKKENTNESFYTLELIGKKITQCRTKGNKSYQTDPEVKEFVDKWLSTIVSKDKKKNNKKNKKSA